MQFQRDVAEQLGAKSLRLTTHGQTIGEKVACVGDQNDQAAFDLRVLVEARVFEHQRAGQAKDHSESHRGEENEEEDTDAVEEGQDVDLLAMELGECPGIGPNKQSKPKAAAHSVARAHTHSNMTMATASLRMLSPKMMLYSFGSTFRALKIASCGQACGKR